MERNKLRGRIIEKFETQEKFAEALGITPGTVSKKLRNESKLTREEIIEWGNLLEIPKDDLPSYFFAN